MKTKGVDMKIGLTCMKCSIHPSSQTNSRTGKQSKTCGLGSAWLEMNDKRFGRDDTIDKSLTQNNVWMVGSSTDDVVNIVQNEMDRINAERKENGLRTLRSDSVSVIEIIEKPPIEYMQELSYEERVQILSDSHEVMSELLTEWNPNWKVIESVQHHDEFGGLSAHNHTLVMLSSIDENGVSTMRAKNEYNLKFFSHLNKKYPEMMRDRGYEVEDVRTYDSLSEIEREERRLHPEEHGVAAYIYKKQKEEELTQKINDLEITAKQIDARIINAKEYEQKILEITKAPSIDTYSNVVNENKELKEKLSLKDRIIESSEAEITKLQNTLNEWKDRFSEMSQRLGSKIMSLFGFEYENENIKQFPDKEIAKEFESLKEETRHYNSDNLRIVPDVQNEGLYRIVERQEDGSYITLKSGFIDRIEAQRYERNLISGFEAMNMEIVDRSIEIR